jgi:hypothetical protein
MTGPTALDPPAQSRLNVHQGRTGTAQADGRRYWAQLVGSSGRVEHWSAFLFVGSLQCSERFCCPHYVIVTAVADGHDDPACDIYKPKLQGCVHRRIYLRRQLAGSLVEL